MYSVTEYYSEIYTQKREMLELEPAVSEMPQRAVCIFLKSRAILVFHIQIFWILSGRFPNYLFSVKPE